MRLPALSNVLVEDGGAHRVVPEGGAAALPGRDLRPLPARPPEAARRRHAAGEPVVTGVLGLPAEASAAFLIGFLRRDFAATRLFDMSRGGGLDRRPARRGHGHDHAVHPLHRERLHDRARSGAGGRRRRWPRFIFPLAFAMGGLVRVLHASPPASGGRRDDAAPVAASASRGRHAARSAASSTSPGGDSCREHGCPIALRRLRHAPLPALRLHDAGRGEERRGPLRPHALPRRVRGTRRARWPSCPRAPSASSSASRATPPSRPA